MIDFGDQLLLLCRSLLLDAQEAATSERSLGDQLLMPGGVTRSVVDVESRPLRQPGVDFGVLVSAGVVDDQVHLDIG